MREYIAILFVELRHNTLLRIETGVLLFVCNFLFKFLPSRVINFFESGPSEYKLVVYLIYEDCFNQSMELMVQAVMGEFMSYKESHLFFLHSSYLEDLN